MCDICICEPHHACLHPGLASPSSSAAAAAAASVQRRPCSCREACRRQILEQHGPPSECACMVCSMYVNGRTTDGQLRRFNRVLHVQTAQQTRRAVTSFSSLDRRSSAFSPHAADITAAKLTCLKMPKFNRKPRSFISEATKV